MSGNYDGTLDWNEAPDEVVEEASTLGFAPGRFPVRFTYDGKVLHLLRVVRDHDGDITSAVYGYDGGRLRVLND